MGTDVATYSADGDAPEAVVERLAEMGFEFGPSRTVSRSLLDTFDRRLYSAGLRLELRESDAVELVLTRDGSARASLVVSSIPRFAQDLPPGPFRSRLAAVADVRALLPILRVTAMHADGFRRNRAGKIVASIALYADVRVDDNDVARSTIEVDELAGYAKHASKARDVLAALGLARLDGDTLTAVAASAGIHLAGGSGAMGIPLDPMMPAIVGFRAVLADLADTMVVNWQGTVDRLDPEFLHDLRVAVRRTRSVVGEGKKVLPPLTVERAEERFGWLGAITGRARDLDVQLINWESDTKPLTDEVVAALVPARTLLERRCESAHDALAVVLQSAEASDLLTAAAAWWREPIPDDVLGIDAQRPLAKIVAKRIARAHASLVKRGRLVQVDSPSEQVHDLRKDAKKLRYLLECFAGLLQDAPRKAFVRRLKTFQDNLGEHHDAAVHVAELRSISRELHVGHATSETMVAIGQLFRLLDQRRIARRFEFAEHFAAYDTKATQRALDTALAGMT